MAHEISSGFLRLFIAIPVPASVCGEIARAQGQLRRSAPSGAIRWTRAEQFHLTLKFLGDVALAQSVALREPMTQICNAFSAINLTATGLGYFPNSRHPRVIWVGVQETTGRLVELQRQIELAVQPFAPTEKPQGFSAHITLGRVKPGFHGSLESVWERAKRLRDRQFCSWQADEVVICRSVLTPDGAVYEPFHRCRLGA